MLPREATQSHRGIRCCSATQGIFQSPFFSKPVFQFPAHWRNEPKVERGSASTPSTAAVGRPLHPHPPPPARQGPAYQRGQSPTSVPTPYHWRRRRDSHPRPPPSPTGLGSPGRPIPPVRPDLGAGGTTATPPSAAAKGKAAAEGPERAAPHPSSAAVGEAQAAAHRKGMAEPGPAAAPGPATKAGTVGEARPTTASDEQPLRASGSGCGDGEGGCCVSA
jgi:hypothetical protein